MSIKMNSSPEVPAYLFVILLSGLVGLPGAFAQSPVSIPSKSAAAQPVSSYPDSVSISADNVPQNKPSGPSLGMVAAAHGIRTLPFTPSDPAFFHRNGGKPGVLSFKTLKDLGRVLKKAEAQALVAGVNFNTEQVVLVLWTTSGPPDGVLSFRMEQGSGGQQRGVFFVQEPPESQIRGMRFSQSAHFFSVPKNMNVTFAANTQP